jgi:hypothetical protein
MTKLKDGINNAYFTILRFCHTNEVFIYFDFDHIKPKEIYTIIAEISTVLNLRGVFSNNACRDFKSWRRQRLYRQRRN